MLCRKLAMLCLLMFAVSALLGACSAKNSIVGHWQFTRVNDSWFYKEMHFTEYPYAVTAYSGRLNNVMSFHGSWRMLSRNRLEVSWHAVNNQIQINPKPIIFQVKITGNTLYITDEYGNAAIGTRLSDPPSSDALLSLDSAPLILLVLSILLAVGTVGVHVMRRYRKPQSAKPAVLQSSGHSHPQVLCMHCGQPVQAGHKFCMHCGKPLL